MAAQNLSIQGRDDAIESLRSTIFNSGLPAGTLAPLTTAAGLRAAFVALGRHQSESDMNVTKSVRDFDICVADGILTDAIAAAGDTIALLIAGLDAKHSTPTALPSRPTHLHFNH